MIGGQGTPGNGRKLTFGIVLEAGEFKIAVLDPYNSLHVEVHLGRAQAGVLVQDFKSVMPRLGPYDRQPSGQLRIRLAAKQ
jgi:hypothetical protein